MNQIVTYESANATNPDMKWAAYVVLSNGTYWGVMFTAATEDGAVSKARDQWDKDRKRMPYHPDMYKDQEVYEEPTPSKAAPKAPKAQEMTSSRGAHFANTAWVINKTSREKLRIPKDQVESYLAKGYERGGPRSK